MDSNSGRNNLDKTFIYVIDPESSVLILRILIDWYDDKKYKSEYMKMKNYFHLGAIFSNYSFFAPPQKLCVMSWQIEDFSHTTLMMPLETDLTFRCH